MYKRLAMSLLAVAAISALVIGGTFALFTASTTNQSNTFTAGTVTLDAHATNLVNVTNIAPGDSGTATYSVKYTGSLDAWLGLSTTLSGDLTTCDGGGKYTYSISDGTKSYNANAADQVIKKVVPNETVTFTLTGALNLNAGNDCQGDSATFSMLVKAVQARNNTNGTNDGPISWN